MSQQWDEKAENLRELMRQHWLHCRHLESERAWFMSVYAAITGGMFAFMAYSGLQTTWPLYFLVGLTFVGFFLTIRWTYGFECHRKKVNDLARSLWTESWAKMPLDPTMNIPAMHILPASIRWIRIPDSLRRTLNELFRTRYWFALFYLFVLTVLVALSFLNASFTTWGKGITIATLAIAFILGIRWYFSLKEIGKEKRVILEGSNGEWAQAHYLPFLAKKAARGDIELWAVDIEDKINISHKVERDWQVARTIDKAHYLNKSKDAQVYSQLSSADYVFIVTPDHCHSETATSWLRRLSPGGKIFVEKPLDASVGSALELKKQIAGKETVFGFDHYLARAYPFLHRSKHYIKKIRGIKKIEFRLVESDNTLKNRAETLDKGAIFDLFCHVLSVTCATVYKNSTCSEPMIKSINLDKVKVTQYANSPIRGEKFVNIKFTVNPAIKVVSDVGYKAKITKRMTLKALHGNSNIKLDFIKDEFSISDSHGKEKKPRSLNPKHVETFLERILDGKQHPLSVPGVLSFDAALEILAKIEEAKP